jgi:hypothetical protein
MASVSCLLGELYLLLIHGVQVQSSVSAAETSGAQTKNLKLVFVTGECAHPKKLNFLYNFESL